MDRVLRFLRAGAVSRVIAAWLLFPTVVVAALGRAFGTGIDSYHFPYHPLAPIQDAIDEVFLFAVPAGLLAAVASSIALALKLRSVASGLVVSIWSVFLIYAGWALSVVKPGPEYLERHLGSRNYLISWHFAPLGSRRDVSTDRFEFNVCLNTLQGGYGWTCKENDQSQVLVSLREGGFTAWGKSEERIWRARLYEMDQGEPRYGYDTFIHTPPQDSSQRTTRYRVRRDAEGRLMRLVACHDFGTCWHHALVEDYALSYKADNLVFSQWETTDRKLVDLINSWRVR